MTVSFRLPPKTKKGETLLKLVPRSHRRRRISFDISLRVGPHSDTNSESDEDTCNTSCGRHRADRKIVPWQTSIREAQKKKRLQFLKENFEKVKVWECFFFHRKDRLILLVYVDHVKLVGSRERLSSHVGKIAKEDRIKRSSATIRSIIPGMHPHFSQHYNIKCSIIFHKERRHNSPQVSPWSCDMKAHAEQCVERQCDLAKKISVSAQKAGDAVP